MQSQFTRGIGVKKADNEDVNDDIEKDTETEVCSSETDQSPREADLMALVKS